VRRKLLVIFFFFKSIDYTRFVSSFLNNFPFSYFVNVAIAAEDGNGLVAILADNAIPHILQGVVEFMNDIIRMDA